MMPGLDVMQVSSNWKKLQEKLQAEKGAGTHNPLKRKRLEQKQKGVGIVHGVKKPKILRSEPRKTTLLKGTNMGASQTKPATEPPRSTGRTKLLRDHDIAPEDISAAYGSSGPSTTGIYDDDINGGLHPTRKAGKYIALDCEMVGTGPPPHDDNILARASLVNFHGEQIYDSFVLPPPGLRVLDYRTHVSGVTPQHLRPGFARSFVQVQKDVADLLQDRILVGHALKNDLLALTLSHPRRDLRDTSRHPKFRVESRGKPPALRKLARSELGMSIQTGEHSSIEDARAAMLLFKKEKAGFEEENRRTFGQHVTKFDGVRKQASKQRGKVDEVEEDDDQEEDEESDDLDLLDGEEGEDDDDEEATARLRGAIPSVGGGTIKPKKRKKKKRTKRH
nr:rna exonuclease 4 [Quercus suber]